jgi:predicted DNA-binding transcriptional regulator YafY
MSRTERLLDLLQLLRRHRQPVRGAAIAQALGISLRTLYRDIGTLQAQGARIDGAPGLGYVMQPGFSLPPLMFSVDEVEALALGSRWVAERGDPRLAAAAHDALAKIAAVLPPEQRHALDSSGLLAGPGAPSDAADLAVGTIRQAIRAEHKLVIGYRDAADRSSQRTVWPIALGFFDRARVLVAWCELRASMRHFRTDRITALATSDERYPRRRQTLMAEWRAQEGIDQRP